MQESLQLLTDLDQIRDAFSIWRHAMQSHGRSRGRIHWLPEAKIYFRINGNNCRLGSDPTGEKWIVELNEPRQGPENPLSGVARNSAGRRYLLRQGTLHENAQSSRIEGLEFEARTGLLRSKVTIDGRPTKRAWFIVTAIDGLSSADICQDTAAFLDRCILARGRDARRDNERLTELFGKPEQGGQLSGLPTINLNQRRRIQGYVWEALNTRLIDSGRALAKPRHARGYEVDGEIETKAGKLLLEIKTGTNATDVYAGIGQLALYPRLLPGLSDHRRVLLLPGSPQDALVEAVSECGVELHSYNLEKYGEEVRVTFSPRFLLLCDLSS